MKPLRWAAAALFVSMSTAGADEFADFRIPDHRVHDWSADLFLSGSRDAFSTSPDHNTTHRRFDATLATSAFWLRDSDSRQTRLSADGFVMDERRWERTVQGAFPVFSATQSRRDLLASERWALAIGHRHYPWAIPVGFAFDAAGSGFYRQAWQRQAGSQVDFLLGPRRWFTQERNTETWIYDHRVSGSVGLGLGRIRDATGVFEARVLEQRLLESGALTRELSPAARRRLAQLLYTRRSYESVLERPARTLWREVERLLAADGALRETGLTAHDVLRAGEPLVGARSFGAADGLPRSTVLRRRGFFAGVQLMERHVSTVTRVDLDDWQQTTIGDTAQTPLELESHFRSHPSTDEVLLGPTLEYARPLGPRLQVDLASSVLFQIHSNDEGMDLWSSGSVAYIVADRVLLTASGSYQRTTLRHVPTDQMLRDFWATSFGIRAAYYLEDHLELSLQAREQQQRATPLGDTFVRFGTLSLGLTYRLTGGIRVPGIAEPVRIP